MSQTPSSAVANRKPERLINLTLALLATRRYLTKAEIFATVAGYEGKIETQERMFERDKDDLRSMGIEIEVGNLDPFFEDEPGYRISASSYALTLNELNSTEVALLSLAAGLWHQSALSENSMSALRKLKSLGIPADFSAAGVLDAKFEEPAEYFDTILEAISDGKELNFRYRSSSTKLRKVHPYTLTLWNGSWYLIAHDLDAGELRTFKLARIIDSVEMKGKKNAFTIPTDFTAHHSLFREESAQLELAKVRIRKGQALTLRNSGNFLGDDGEFDLYEIPYDSLTNFARSILWHGSNVAVIEPINLRTHVLSLLSEAAHG